MQQKLFFKHDTGTTEEEVTGVVSEAVQDVKAVVAGMVEAEDQGARAP